MSVLFCPSHQNSGPEHWTLTGEPAERGGGDERGRRLVVEGGTNPGGEERSFHDELDVAEPAGGVQT